jgi:VanZ family protein
MRRVLQWLPFALACAAIFALSSMSRPPIPEQLIFWQSDKLLHALAYLGLGALAAFGLWPARAWRSRLAAWGLAVSYGALDELHQRLVPGRSCSGWDLLADALGAALGVACVAALATRWHSGER